VLAAFLSDFGLDDVYVGVMKAVLLGRCPGAQIVDLTHGIPPQDVLLGALALEDALPYLPRDSVVVAVVDPGVGSERAALAARAGGCWLLGPDNGLLSWCLGDDAEVVRIEAARYRLPELSSTFHGRDVFAPAAAHLLMGAELSMLGAPVETWVKLDRPAPRRLDGGALEAHVIAVDRFGNLILDARAGDLPARPLFSAAGRELRGMVRTYADADGALCALVGSFGRVEIALPNGSAAAELALGRGAPILVEPG
jgi:S-adenosylmethionine hydrolase